MNILSATSALQSDMKTVILNDAVVVGGGGHTKNHDDDDDEDLVSNAKQELRLSNMNISASQHSTTSTIRSTISDQDIYRDMINELIVFNNVDDLSDHCPYRSVKHHSRPATSNNNRSKLMIDHQSRHYSDHSSGTTKTKVPKNGTSTSLQSFFDREKHERRRLQNLTTSWTLPRNEQLQNDMGIYRYTHTTSTSIEACNDHDEDDDDSSTDEFYHDTDHLNDGSSDENDRHSCSNGSTNATTSSLSKTTELLVRSPPPTRYNSVRLSTNIKEEEEEEENEEGDETDNHTLGDNALDQGKDNTEVPNDTQSGKKNNQSTILKDSLYYSPKNEGNATMKHQQPRKKVMNDLLSGMNSTHTSTTEVTTAITEVSDDTMSMYDTDMNTSSFHSRCSLSTIGYNSPMKQQRSLYKKMTALPNSIILQQSIEVFGYSAVAINDDANLKSGTPPSSKEPNISSLQTHCLLGEGFFGKVYLVSSNDETSGIRQRFDSNNKCYALKKLSKYHLLCEDQIHTVIRERDILRTVGDHPNIVSLYDTYQDTSHLYFLQSYIPGGELFTLIHHFKDCNSGVDDSHENTSLSSSSSRMRLHPILCEEHNVQFYVACIVDALWYLHCGISNQPIVYRDLKPENIMINAQGYPILIDFGYAKVLEISPDSESPLISCNKTYTMCGTAKYLSPEIIEGSGHTCSTDYWSLGILVYELLTYGEHAFEFYNEMDDISLYRCIAEADYIPLPYEDDIDNQHTISEAACDFVDQLLTKDPIVRIGATETTLYNPILLHPWLRHWDIQLLREQSYPAPWIPALQNMLDTKYFVASLDENNNSNNSISNNGSFASLDRPRATPALTMKEQAKFALF